MNKFNLKNIRIVEQKTVYQGFFKINQYTLQHTLFSGGQSRPLMRECFERGHAVGVLAYDPWQDAIVLLEQFRIGAYVNIKEQSNAVSTNECTPWLLEIIAGIVEPGESATDVAYREANEEAGVALLALQAIGNFYSSPGGSSETTELYCACIHSEGVGGLYGLSEEGEDIRAKIVSYSDCVHLLEQGRLNNASAMIAIQWLIIHRHELRKKWLSL